ncbi:hypothetical protein KIH39_07870 [Telmatocola sphagniphila]|uniref:Uncharacterized protein n=1 Tax=Telmatocola sphagniphila TaxID=1123043 RepID=A0A8E6B9F2_9BACT|nr:hypothetical protein KIH39_07870 [Telmatocola sphagniphila]
MLEPTHNAQFVALRNHFRPRWHDHRNVLNRLQLGHEIGSIRSQLAL